MEIQPDDKEDKKSFQNLLKAQQLLKSYLSDLEYFDKIWEEIIAEYEKNHGPIKRNKDGKPSLFITDPS